MTETLRWNASAYPASPFRLDGTRALVTGASRGIGAAVAVAIAEAGADLALSARTSDALSATADLVRESGHAVTRVPGDLNDPGAADRVVTDAVGALGGLDVLVHCAGILPSDAEGRPALKPLAATTAAEWAPVLTVNLEGTVALCRAAYPHLARSPRASVVLVSSVAGLIGTPLMEAYAVTKAAQVSLARSLSAAWAPDGIRVNALCPGWVRTDMTAAVHGVPEVSDWLIAHVPLRRWAEPAEAAHAALFLVSPAASFVTGHALVVDGGLTIPDGGLTFRPLPAPPLLG
jgi:NAD(P)-dependent dehydrogenase (short-subunit alcohol dehydrogenase family)